MSPPFKSPSISLRLNNSKSGETDLGLWSYLSAVGFKCSLWNGCMPGIQKRSPKIKMIAVVDVSLGCTKGSIIQLLGGAHHQQRQTTTCNILSLYYEEISKSFHFHVWLRSKQDQAGCNGCWPNSHCYFASATKSWENLNFRAIKASSFWAIKYSITSFFVFHCLKKNVDHFHWFLDCSIEGIVYFKWCNLCLSHPTSYRSFKDHLEDQSVLAVQLFVYNQP